MLERVQETTTPATPATANGDVERAFRELMAALTPADRAVVQTDIRQRAAERRRAALLAQFDNEETRQKNRALFGF